MPLAPQEIRTFFITAVTANRRKLFQVESNANLLLDILNENRSKGRLLIHAFVIMPDHLHALITPTESIERSAQLIKGGLSFAIREQFKGTIWQEGFHEHRIRDLEDFQNQRLYIANNPTRKGYEEYPFVHTVFPQNTDSAPSHL